MKRGREKRGVSPFSFFPVSFIDVKSTCLERNKGDVASPFEGMRQEALMMGAGASDAPGQDFPLLGDKTAQTLDVFVINHFHLFHAKSAHFPLGKTLWSSLVSSILISIVLSHCKFLSKMEYYLHKIA